MKTYNTGSLSDASLSSINFSDLNDQFGKCVEFISEVIDSYQVNNPDANLINMAKTKSFTDELIKRLKDEF